MASLLTRVLDANKERSIDRAGSTCPALLVPCVSCAAMALVASSCALLLAPVEKGAFGPELSAAEGFDFMSASLAQREDRGAWLTWVGNGRSWMRAVRCG